MLSSSKSLGLVSLVGLAVIALGAVACAVPVENGNPTGQSSAANTKGGFFRMPNTAPPTMDNGGGRGSCDNACAHYLSCKGADTAENRAECTRSCRGLGLTPEQLAAYEQTDCATAIAEVEGSGSAQPSGSGSGSSKGSECDGCVRDGSSCVWMSQSNWGSGPYSGAVSECSAHCCE